MRTNYRVTGVVVRERKILLIHRFKQGAEYWVFPGGGVEEGESWEEALKRELLEETGLGLQSYTFLYESTENPGCLFYTCELQPGEPKIGGPELEEQSSDNQFILEWVAVEKVFTLQNLYPQPNRKKITLTF